MRNLEALENMARDTDSPLATEPKLFTADGSEYLQEISSRFPIGDVVDFAAQTHQVEPDRLSSLAIQLSSTYATNEGLLASSPRVMEDKLYYPYIEVAITPRLPALTDFALRHELRHVFQPQHTPFYARKGVGAAVRIAGAVGVSSYIVASALNHGQGFPNTDAALETSLLSISTGCAVGGWRVPWLLSAQEWSANKFAYRTRSFRPFTDTYKSL